MGIFEPLGILSYRPVSPNILASGGNSGGKIPVESSMPRDGAIIFGDLIGKLDAVRATCSRCGRDGRYQLQNLISERGRDGKIIGWLDALTAHCPIKKAHNWNDQCAARCPDLPKVL